MLIEKEKIIEAKEKLGDKNAFIMAEELGLKDFDERNLKACCPYHDEDTPSFVYDKKRFRFKCFGCGVSVDILDVFMGNNLTYNEACEKLFEAANVTYSFGEKGVKTKQQYRYPKAEQCIIKDKVYKYLECRGIPKEVVDKLDIRQDNHGNCVFNYYDTNDVLTMVKYRPSHNIDKSKGEIKNWAQKDADTTPLLYNMNRININMPLLICEGEIDAAAAIACGYTNTVSVPFGAGNFTWIENNWDWLEQFDSIIIASDNDEAGKKMRKEVVYRLGSWRCKVVDIPSFVEKDGKKIPVSDINEMMYWFGKEAVLGAILNAKDQPVASVVDFADITDVDLADIDGIYTGIEEFDQELMRLFYGTFNIVTGVNGCVDAETEYFNGKEWKRISEYTEGEMVMEWHTQNYAKMVQPLEYHVYDNNVFIHITCDSMHQCVSLEHNLVFWYKDKMIKIPTELFLYFYNHITHPLYQNILKELRFVSYDRLIRAYDVDVEYQKVKSKKYCFTVPSGMLVLRRNGVTFITGNSGKSSFLSQLLCQSVDQGKDAWLYSKELPNYMSKNWINYIFAGSRHVKKYVNEHNAVYYKVPPDIKRKVDEYYRGHIFIYKDDYENSVECIRTSMEDSARKYGAKLFILDNLTAINMNCKDDEKWGSQVDLVNWCIEFAKKFHVVVILVIHPKKIETMRRLTKFDVQGLGSIVDLAHRLLSLYRVTPKDKQGERSRRGDKWYREPIKYDVLCDVLKDRMTGKENLAMGLYYDNPSRRFFTNYEEYVHQYNWDSEVYPVPLPKPKQLIDKAEEVFGTLRR